jgi:hypothetical protein
MTIRKTVDRITTSLNRVQQRLDQLPQAAYDHWVSITPRDSGRARRSTRLQGKTIRADYPYARRLDEGWSGQAPEGMSKPTDRFIESWLRRNIRK